MKKVRIIALVLACMALLSIGAFAAESRASDQISRYDIVVTPMSGYINVKASVYGKGLMDKLGCQSIYVYEENGSSWNPLDNDEESASNMCVNNASKHVVNKQYNTEEGKEYKVVVTVFAEKDGDRDTRTRTFFVTGE